MDRLFPTSRKNPCPICGDVTGKCRTKDNEEQAVLCAGSGNAKKFDREGEYVCVSHSGKGHTQHTWVIDNVGFEFWEDKRKADYFLEKSRRQELNIKLRQEAIANELSLDARHKYNLQLLGELSLSDSHRKLLLQRGLTDAQINNFGYRSVKQYQKLTGNYPKNYPGYNTSKGNLVNAASGILCPIWQFGKIAGFEIRLDEVKESEGRYRILSSQTFTGCYLWGEIPIPILPSQQQTKIYITEGKGLKPTITHAKFGVNVIGYGRYLHLNPKHQEEYLATLQGISKEVVLCPDAGDVQNKQVWEKWEDEYNFYKTKGFDVAFGWWGQVDKDACDVDELASLDSIEYLGLEQIKKIVNEHEKAKLDDISWERYLKAKKYTPTKGFQFKDKNFKLPAKTPKKNAIIGIKSGLGTGKTEAMILEMIANEKDHKVKCLLIGYLNNLLRQTEGRAAREGLKLLHLNALDTVNQEDNLSFCLHSAYKDDIDYVGKDVYFDEAESIFSTIINGGNLTYYEQERAMKSIEHIVNVANRVFLVDANLTDDLVDFFASLDRSKKEVIKIENTHKIAPHKIIIADGIEKIEVDGEEIKYKLKPKAKSHLIKLLSEPGTIPIVASDSMKFCHALGEELKAKGKNGIVISSRTVGEDYAKKFLDDPNEWIRENKPDFLIMSPSCGSGVSITEPHFNAKFSFFGGVLSTDSQNQFMFRYRLSGLMLSDEIEESIIHYVYCPESSNVHDHTMPKGYTSSSILNCLKSRFEQTFFMSLDVANDQEKAKEHIKKIIADKLASPWLNISTKRWGIENYERWNLRKCLIHKLREDGHDVSVIEEEISPTIETEMKEIKQHLIEKEATALVHSAVLTEEELAKVEKTDHSEAMQLKIKKSRMFVKRLPGIGEHSAYKEFSQLFWEKVVSEQGYISSHQHFSRLVNFEDNKLLHNGLIYKATTAEYFFIGSLRGIDYSKIDSLHKLNFEQFLELGREWHKESPELIEFTEAILKDKKLQVSLGLEGIKPQKNNRERIDLLKKFWEYLGIESAKAKKRLVGKKRLHCYEIDIDAYNHPLRQMIIELTQAKDKAQILRDADKVDWQSKTFNGMVEALSEGLLNIKSQEDVVAINSYFDKASEKAIDDDHKQEISKYKAICKKAVDIAADKLLAKYKAVTAFNQYEWLNYNLTVNSNIIIGAYDGNDINGVLGEIVKQAQSKLEPSELQRINNLRPLTSNYMKLIDDSILEAKKLEQKHFDSLNVLVKWRYRLETAVSFGKNFVSKIGEDFFASVPVPEDDNKYFELFNLFESYGC
jgi:hypothetical protein